MARTSRGGVDGPLAPDFSPVGPGDLVLVAVSGGADSLALLRVAHGLAEGGSRRFRVGVIHVHHGMRGTAADRDEQFLRGLCESLGLPVVVARVDVPDRARRGRISAELAGREARYEAFLSAANRLGARWIATAHTEDDQVETILFRLVRGSGLIGLAGIPYRRELQGDPSPVEVIRPLLGWRRSDTEAICSEAGWSPRHDSTNDDLGFSRNRIRQEVLPLLQQVHPAARQAILQLSEEAFIAAASWREQAELAVLAARLSEGNGEARWCTEPLRALPPPAAEWALRLVLERSGAPAVMISREAVRRLRLSLHSGGEPPLTLAGGLHIASVEGCVLVVRALAGAAPNRPAEAAVDVPGQTAYPAFGLSLRSEVLPVPHDLKTGPWVCHLPRRELQGPLRLRGPRVGERMRPFGAPGRRLISDILSEARTRRETRGAYPILADDAGALWVVGLAASERCRLRAGEGECIRVSAFPLSEALP